MGVIIGIVLVVVILLLAGVSLSYIIIGIAGLVALAALFTLVFFAVCWAGLLCSVRKKAHFSRFERGNRFESAVYLIDNEEYHNVFPAEFVMREKLYKPEREVTVRVTKLRRRQRSVFDRNALITSVVGLPVSLMIFAAFGWFVYFMMG